MLSTQRFSKTTLTAIGSEPAVPLEQMPQSWQQIATGTWMTEPWLYSAMARVFLAKNLHGQILFLERPDTECLKDAYCQGYFIEHGCGCENHLAKLKPCDSPFDYKIPADARRKTLRAFFWSIMEEYVLLSLDRAG